MRTKNIFKAVALAMMMPAMLLTTACSSDDDSIINNENINKQNTAKKGYALPVTVKVTRQGDNATTRATYDANDMKLSFSEGDQLFVKGKDNSDGGAGQFAGLLSWQSGGTFSGTITTENPYSGTADQLFTEANDCNATLLPSGYDDYDYITYEHAEGYDDDICIYTEKAFALTKKAAIEQFSSMEKSSEYNDGFELEPRGAILNFNIIGLEKNKEVNVIINNLGAKPMEGKVTTDETGCATFAIGIYTVYFHDMLDILDVSVGGYAINVSSSHKDPDAGKIYNVTRNVALTNVTASDIGKLIGADGRIYSTQAAATTAGTTAVAMIAYVGTESNCSHGLAIALENVGNGNSWDNSNNNNGGKTAAELCDAWNTSKAVTGGTWRLPSIIDWQNIIIGCGTSGTAVANPINTYMEHEGLLKKLSAAGGITLTSFYWSSTEVNANNAMDLSFNTYNASFSYASKFGQCNVRACLAF